MTPEEQQKFVELMMKFMTQSGGSAVLPVAPAAPQPAVPAHVPSRPNFELGCKPDALGNESPRMYVRMSPATEHYFNEAVEWLFRSGETSHGRRPKAQVLFHAMVHEFCKLSDADRIKFLKPYLD